MKESFVECRINRNIGGDMAEVWYTHCLREYPFPEFLGEKFLGEDIVWVQMSKKYKMRFFNRFAAHSLKKLFENTNSKLLYILCFIPSQVLYYKWKNKYQENI